MGEQGTADRLAVFHEWLAREIREDLSGVVEFEIASGFEPLFRHYYRAWLGSERHLRRVIDGATARRRELPGFVDRLKETFGPHPRVLDIGSGFGSDALLLAWLGCDVTGIDPSARKVGVANHRAEQWRRLLGTEIIAPRFIVGRLEDTQEFARGSLDGAFTSECLHHCEPVENVLLALRGLVPASGRVLVLESNGGCMANEVLLRRQLGNRPRRSLREMNGHYVLYGNENIRSVRSWTRLFRECGFDVTRTSYARHLLLEPFEGLRGADETLCRLPGAAAAAVHVTFELQPSPAGSESSAAGAANETG